MEVAGLCEDLDFLVERVTPPLSPAAGITPTAYLNISTSLGKIIPIPIPQFQSHPHARFSSIAYLVVDETGILYDS